ncbi:MAG: hypothetical protein R2794_11980 [Chitinophagales bacterium]
MKTVFTIMAILFSTGLFAGTDGNKDSSDRSVVIDSIATLMGSDDVINALGVSGQADVTITLDEQGVVHVEEVQANNYLLEYHIRQSLDGVKMMVSESLVGKTINFFMDIVQSK